MVGWPHCLNGHEFEQALGDEVQGRLECYSPWCHKESDTTERLHLSLLHLGPWTTSVNMSDFQSWVLYHLAYLVLMALNRNI